MGRRCLHLWLAQREVHAATQSVSTPRRQSAIRITRTKVKSVRPLAKSRSLSLRAHNSKWKDPWMSVSRITVVSD